jgi:hypothetical protein
MFASPVGVRGFIAGLPGSGKSSFFQTCPDAFIFNLDLSSTAIPIIDGKIPEPKAVSWPGIAPPAGAFASPVDPAAAPAAPPAL